MANCIACSFTSVLYGLRLRVNGETQEQSVRDLVNTIPKITSAHENIMLIFDWGYGKLSFVDTMPMLKFSVKQLQQLLLHAIFLLQCRNLKSREFLV